YRRCWKPGPRSGAIARNAADRAGDRWRTGDDTGSAAGDAAHRAALQRRPRDRLFASRGIAARPPGMRFFTAARCGDSPQDQDAEDDQPQADNGTVERVERRGEVSELVRRERSPQRATRFILVVSGACIAAGPFDKSTDDAGRVSRGSPNRTSIWLF